MLILFYKTLKQLFWMNKLLEVARRYREDMFSLQPDNDFNKCNHHAAYRQYVLYMDIWGLETDGQFQAAVS